ncbi:hypothetical protein [Simplicispira suum]|jgi:hypothetical protein|uniref:Uncharacterized protein n=1 Tax=Simplicispira suum TaxID=2109915 RepID=A0A2S0N111_9BURK|nr:hypothetical protein [Simplicispira suum]AVO41832.1 hypothetical protein C6571_11550 [Simplicispira suum]MBW7832551.1 hypothetical protein [Simplicispira suum]MCB1977995.1 hypothetical protein [Burkholderiaceae bacterium]MCO5102467.1 hypothetical protein [Burkholderiaceae bacterium]
MPSSVFPELRFWLLIAVSLVLPIAIYLALLFRRAVSSLTVLALGMLLIVLAGVDVYLLQSLSHLAEKTVSVLDDAVFLSEVGLALYVLPVLFGGIGVNLVSHVLLRHLTQAERRFDAEHRDD